MPKISRWRPLAAASRTKMRIICGSGMSRSRKGSVDLSPFTRKNRISRELDESSRRRERDYDGLCAQLNDSDPSVRRLAARDLAAFPRSTGVLTELLLAEVDHSVREACFASLAAIGGGETVQALMPILKSEDVALRNGAVELLAQLPEELEPFLQNMLADRDSDTRVFAVGIIGLLALPSAPRLLRQVLEAEEHVNVVAVAIEGLSETGSREALPFLAGVKERFSQEPFIRFAVDSAIKRIEG
jgi:HEAT repeat protein